MWSIWSLLVVVAVVEMPLVAVVRVDCLRDFQALLLELNYG
jgi:hypothetical protein